MRAQWQTQNCNRRNVREFEQYGMEVQGSALAPATIEAVGGASKVPASAPTLATPKAWRLSRGTANANMQVKVTLADPRVACAKG